MNSIIKKGWIYWTPRIASIVFLLFLAMFSLDIFDAHLNFWGTVLGLFMHNIPVFILTIFVIIAWKHDLVGAITFALAGLIYISRLLVTILMNTPHEWNMLVWTLPISFPAFFVAVLFFIGWKRN